VLLGWNLVKPCARLSRFLQLAEAQEHVAELRQSLVEKDESIPDETVPNADANATTLAYTSFKDTIPRATAAVLNKRIVELTAENVDLKAAVESASVEVAETKARLVHFESQPNHGGASSTLDNSVGDAVQQLQEDNKQLRSLVIQAHETIQRMEHRWRSRETAALSKVDTTVARADELQSALSMETGRRLECEALLHQANMQLVEHGLPQAHVGPNSSSGLTHPPQASSSTTLRGVLAPLRLSSLVASSQGATSMDGVVDVGSRGTPGAVVATLDAYSSQHPVPPPAATSRSDGAATPLAPAPQLPFVPPAGAASSSSVHARLYEGLSMLAGHAQATTVLPPPVQAAFHLTPTTPEQENTSPLQHSTAPVGATSPGLVFPVLKMSFPPPTGVNDSRGGPDAPVSSVSLYQHQRQHPPRFGHETTHSSESKREGEREQGGGEGSTMWHHRGTGGGLSILRDGDAGEGTDTGEMAIPGMAQVPASEANGLVSAALRELGQSGLQRQASGEGSAHAQALAQATAGVAKCSLASVQRFLLHVAPHAQACGPIVELGRLMVCCCIAIMGVGWFGHALLSPCRPAAERCRWDVPSNGCRYGAAGSVLLPCHSWPHRRARCQGFHWTEVSVKRCGLDERRGLA